MHAAGPITFSQFRKLLFWDGQQMYNIGEDRLDMYAV